jgi:putative aminopeptidase FrvX
MGREAPDIGASSRAEHLAWLLALAQVPTASGREHRVMRWVERWVQERDRLELTRDESGNMHVAIRGAAAAGVRPLYFTAHLDHPAFVVERIVAPTVIELSFRGGVMDEYFREARVVVTTGDDQSVRAQLTGEVPGAGGPFKHYLAEIRGRAEVHVGDVAVWDVGESEVIDGLVHTPACDDLAALGAAISAMDVLLRIGCGDVRLLLTRAEEIGFIGAIAAVKHGTMPRDARVIALENSRSFEDSPIGGGPIVRVGDRISVFSPSLTDAIAKRAEEVAGGPASVTAAQKATELSAWRWQRKLMAGGACEASVFCANGYEATCVCLPLGNYHNMADLTNVQAGKNTTPPRVAREYIAKSDYEGLVDLLVACGQHLPAGGVLTERFDKLWKERSFVL